MKKLSAAVALVAATSAFASGDSGTSSVNEMNLSGGQFLMLVGALVGLGVVIWLVAKVASR